MTRPSTPKSLLTLTAAAALLALPTSCRRMTGDEGLAEEGSDSMEASANEGSLLMIAADPAPMAIEAGAGAGAGGPNAEGGPGGEAAAAAAAANFGKYLVPPGCGTATQTGSTVVYTFTDCTGPHGLVHVTGMMTVDFDRQADGLHIHGVATGLQVNGGTLNVDTSAVLSVADGRKKLTVSTKKNGVGPRGRAFDHTGDYTFTWDPATRCHGLDGTWSTKGIVRAVSTTVAGYARCPGACATGGTITHTGAGGGSVTITFDGSATAHWSTSKGKSGTVMLFCGGK